MLFHRTRIKHTKCLNNNIIFNDNFIDRANINKFLDILIDSLRNWAAHI